MKGESPRPSGPLPTVGTEQKCLLSLEKKYLALTEKDLKKASSLARLPKMSLKLVPQLEVRSATGEGNETLYLFQHPDPAQQYQVANISVHMSAALTEQRMAPASWLWAGQEEKMFVHAVETQQEGNGASGVLTEKHKLMDLDSFIKTKLKKKSEAGDLGDDDGDEEMACKQQAEGEEMIDVQHLVGPAAQGLVIPQGSGGLLGRAPSSASIDLECKLPPPSVKKQKAGDSLGGSPSDGMSVVESLNYDGDDGDAAAKWAKKVPLSKVLDESIDGRSVNGLKKAVKRLMAKADSRPQGVLLQSYEDKVKLCQKIVPSVLQSVESSELQKGLEMLVAEETALPGPFKEALLKKRVESLVQQNQVTALLPVINPWKQAESFDPFKPCLADAYTKGKQTMFNKVVHTDTLYNMLFRGEEGKEQVAALANACLSLFGDADMTEKTPQECAAHDDCCTLWRALHSLAVPSLTDENQESWVANKEDSGKRLHS
eukprot:6491527-Amphidinium_carterae.4